MRTVRLRDTTVETTVLGLGTAGLLSERDAAARRRLVAAALDAGVRHFDVAPMYGLGRCEHELGRLLRGRRDEVVVATKFGIETSAVARAIAPFQGPLLAVARRARAPGPVDARSGAAGTALYRSPGYDASTARSSLQRSLRRLGTDYIDVYFLHDPRPGDVASDDVRGFLEEARDAGLIRAWGVAGEPAAAGVAAATIGAGAVLQIREDIFLRPSRPATLTPSLVFGTLTHALARVEAHLDGDPAARRRWNDRLGADLGRDGVVGSFLLRDALERDPATVVLVGTTRPERVAAAAEAAETTHDERALEAFRRLVEAEIASRR